MSYRLSSRWSSIPIWIELLVVLAPTAVLMPSFDSTSPFDWTLLGGFAALVAFLTYLRAHIRTMGLDEGSLSVGHLFGRGSAIVPLSAIESVNVNRPLPGQVKLVFKSDSKNTWRWLAYVPRRRLDCAILPLAEHPDVAMLLDAIKGQRATKDDAS